MIVRTIVVPIRTLIAKLARSSASGPLTSLATGFSTSCSNASWTSLDAGGDEGDAAAVAAGFTGVEVVVGAALFVLLAAPFTGEAITGAAAVV